MAKKKAAPSTQEAISIKGKTFAFTGSLRCATKADAAKRVSAAGGKTASGVSAKIDYLVVGAANTAAERHARKLIGNGASIRLLDENQFRSLFMPTQEQIVAMLRGGLEGLESWNSLISDRFYWPPIIDLSGINLRGLVLPKLNLQRIPMDGADLSETDLTGCNIHDLNGVYFDGACLAKGWASNFTRCSFKKANLSGLQHQIHSLTDCDFSQARLVGLHAPYTYANRCLFRSATLRGSAFDTSRFKDVDFTNADLTETDLSKSDLRGVILTGATLTGAKLMKARLNKADLTKADLRGANLMRADLTNARIEGADFTGANIRGAKVGTLDPVRAKGLDLARALPLGKLGPSGRRLAIVARKAKEVSTRIDVEAVDGRYTLAIQSWGNGLVGAGLSYERGNHSYSGPADGNSISSCLLNFADAWGNAELLPETVTVHGKQIPISLEDLQSLALAAWCEAFGVPVPEKKSQ